MTRTLILSVLLMPAALGLLSRPDTSTAAAASRAETVRTLYFTALDDKGAPVTDLAPADLAIKENGKDRTIATLQHATAPLQVAILVDDAGSGGFRSAVAQFLQRVSGRGIFAISLLSPQPIKVADFTTDVNELNGAINRLGPRGRVVPDTEQIIEAVRESANALQGRRGRRAIVVLTVAGEKAGSDLADDALGALKRSGATLSVVSIMGADSGRVLGDGPRQSGGTVLQVSGQTPVGTVLAQVADNLLSQYVLTYTLPDGVKPNEKLSLSTSRKGVTLLAPSRIPDK